MSNRIEEENLRFADPNDINSQIREYVKLKATIDAMEQRSAELRTKLMAEIDTNGYADENGNLQLDLGDSVDGVYRLEKQRRTKRKLNEDRAKEILDEVGLTDVIYEMKPVLNEDALMAAFYEEHITENQLDEMFPLTVTWALRTIK